MDLNALGLLLIGALIGWFIHQLLDIMFWRNHRICTESETDLRQQIKQYEAERQSNQTRLADYEDRLSLYEKGNVPAAAPTIEYDGYDVDEPATADYTVSADADLDLPTVDFTPPNLDVGVPQVDVPEVEMPDVNIPDVDVPEFNMPDMGAKAGLVGAAGLATQIDMPSTSSAPDFEIDLPELNADADLDVDSTGEMGSESGVDDLKIVWGIGSAVEELLNNHNITTFAQLANTSIGELSDILNAGGDRFNMLQPYTWPDQARLANDGNWATLEKLQSELGE